MSALVIDAFEFGRSNGHRDGTMPVARMTRLSKDCADDSGELSWAIDGSTTIHGHAALTVAVAGTVQLVCQRCLNPYAFAFDASTVLVLGKDDDEADQIEEMLDDESIDVIVGSRSCDLGELIEDEALLALPQVPKHDVCPDTKLLDALNAEKPSPFAGLKDIKTDTPQQQ